MKSKLFSDIRHFLPVSVILYCALVYRAFILNSLYPIPFKQESLFIFDLISFSITIPFWQIVFLGLLNILLIFLIGAWIFDRTTAYFCAFLYAISPWTVYLEVAGSVYIFILTLMLSSFLGLLMIKKDNLNKGLTLVGISSIILLLSSFWSFPILFFLVVVLIKQPFIPIYPLEKLLPYILSTVFLIFILVVINQEGIKNILQKEISLNQNVGIINSVNNLRGESSKAGYPLLGKIVENKYAYFLEYLIINLLMHLIPVVYFTQELKLLGFSFNPPILLGFLIPLIYGLNKLTNLFKRYPVILVIPFVLMLPSVLSSVSPNLNRLVLVAPILFLITGYGFSILYNSAQKKYKFFKVLALFLIIFQLIVVTSDLIKEKTRIDFFRYPNFYSLK